MTVAACFTIFFSHPRFGSGSYSLAGRSAEQTGTEAADMLPEDMCEDEEPEELDLSTIRDDLDIRVYAGRLGVEPVGQRPDWVFE